tara:strand:- start:324 stop:503 length:180 start_codon:yes stop_codon:yes gene_type:complete
MKSKLIKESSFKALCDWLDMVEEKDFSSYKNIKKQIEKENPLYELADNGEYIELKKRGK